jgi:hypothetical protein
MRAVIVSCAGLAVIAGLVVAAAAVDAGGDVYFGASTQPIYGQEGRVFISLVAPAGGDPIGRLCVPITADPFQVAHAQLTEMPDNGDPCGPATPQLFAEPGDYRFSGGVYLPGEAIAVRYFYFDEFIDGPFGVGWTSMQLSAFPGDTDCFLNVDVVDALNNLRYLASLSPAADCIGSGDIDCDGDVDSVDALGILRHVAVLPPLPVPSGCPPIGPITG